MDIQYSEYVLTPKKRANRLATMDQKHGVYLRATINGIDCFADYFPHPTLGDRPIEVFLQNFKLQSELYDQKVFHLLQKDSLYKETPAKDFLDHQLWTGIESLKAPVVKYKILNRGDNLFVGLLEKGIRIRFDGNAGFTPESLGDFMSMIPKHLHSLIDYMEDPYITTDWTDLPIRGAQDFIEGSPFSYYIYKPNAEFFPEHSVPVIYSAYMGGDLGTWHAYCDMVENGSLKLTHGLITENFYEEQRTIFTGDYFRSFVPDLSAVRSIYQDLGKRDWKHLCSI